MKASEAREIAMSKVAEEFDYFFREIKRVANNGGTSVSFNDIKQTHRVIPALEYLGYRVSWTYSHSCDVRNLSSKDYTTLIIRWD